MNLDYDPEFAIRGLHYDVEKGLLMKLDSFLQISLGTVYRGITRVSDDEVLKIYKNRKVPYRYMSPSSVHQVNIFVYPYLMYMDYLFNNFYKYCL